MRRAAAVLGLVVLGLAGAITGVFATGVDASTSELQATSRVTVIATDFKFKLSKQIVPTGTVIFTVKNRGKIVHDFKIGGKKTKLIKPGQSAVLRVTFKKNAKLTFICTVPGHARLGMKGVLTVGTATPTVTVIATDFKFKLSQQSVPTGTVIFVVKNKGRILHDFKIAGKKTKLIKPGRNAILRVTFKKKAKLPYICTVPGHVRLGMKGVLTVGTAGTPPPTTTTTDQTTTTESVPGPSTTVNVDMFEYRFDLSQPSVPQGTVTFVIRNRGQEPHNFDIAGVKAGAILGPGQSERWTVGLRARSYITVCDVPFHIDRGMTGQLFVT